jgi:hypothetical protein
MFLSQKSISGALRALNSVKFSELTALNLLFNLAELRF